MTQLGLPVPRGFTITTEACRARCATAVSRRARRRGRRTRCAARAALGQAPRRRTPAAPPVRPLRWAGLDARDDGDDPEPRSEPLRRGDRGEATGNRRFAFDAYRRLIQMYGEVVAGIDPDVFASALAALKDERASSSILSCRAATSCSSQARSKTSTAPRPARTSRRIRACSSPPRSGRFSRRGMRRALGCTATSTGSRTSSGQP